MSQMKRISRPTHDSNLCKKISLVLSARWDREQFTPSPNKALSDGPIRTLSSKHKTNWNFKVRRRPLIITAVKEEEQCCLLWLQLFKILICACVQRNTLFQNKRMDPIYLLPQHNWIMNETPFTDYNARSRGSRTLKAKKLIIHRKSNVTNCNHCV